MRTSTTTPSDGSRTEPSPFALVCALLGCLACGCGSAAPPTAETPAAEARPDQGSAADGDPQVQIELPVWIVRVAEESVAVEGEVELREFVRATSDRVAAFLLPEVEGEDLDEARHTIDLLLNIEWSVFLGDEEAFRVPDFKRNLVAASLLGLERALADRGIEQQLRWLRCALIEGQATELRREAFDAARDLVEQRLAPDRAAELGSGLRARLDRIDERAKELAGTCVDSGSAGMMIANAWIDAGFLLSGDVCGVLTWDLYMLILGKDEARPADERAFGPDCTPNVLVFH